MALQDVLVPYLPEFDWSPSCRTSGDLIYDKILNEIIACLSPQLDQSHMHNQVSANQTPGNQTSGNQTPGNQAPGIWFPSSPRPAPSSSFISTSDGIYPVTEIHELPHQPLHFIPAGRSLDQTTISHLSAHTTAYSNIPSQRQLSEPPMTKVDTKPSIPFTQPPPAPPPAPPPSPHLPARIPAAAIAAEPSFTPYGQFPGSPVGSACSLQSPNSPPSALPVAALAPFKPRRVRRRKKPLVQVPSRFCHICARTQKSRKIVCSNIASGRCRKAVCELCFFEHNWDFEDASLSPRWQCPHCIGICNLVPRARCHIYKKTNERRKSLRALPASLHPDFSLPTSPQQDDPCKF